MKKKFKIVLLVVVSLVAAMLVMYYLMVRLTPPVVAEKINGAASVTVDNGMFSTDNGSWLKENKYGLWEMYLKGAPYERGVAFGALADKSHLFREKEEAFISEIEKRIPSTGYLNFLKYMVGWFNRDLDDYVPREFLEEIYGSSKYMADEYDYIAPKFHRALSYHAAHDIGHALQNMNLVGCTSFATWDENSRDSSLLIGRNFDFYFGQDFAKDKIVAFYKPDSGYQFMSVTWACFSGVVSGMNEKGLTVTLNAAKSAIPTKGKTPVSLIARQILQYASNIQEAFEIAENYDSFVAESFLIGSKADHKVGLIEKSTDKTALYLSGNDEMVITNHFQSDALKNDPLNLEYKSEEVSDYRYDRVLESIDSLQPLSPVKVAKILRDKRGLGDKNIGLSNEKAINQLIAHHSVIFSPTDMVAWVSAPPYVLGSYVAYDLNAIFHLKDRQFTYTDSLTLPADPFLNTEQYNAYERFVMLKEKVQNYLYKGEGERLTDDEIDEMIAANPDGFLTYYYLGDYMLAIEDYKRASEYFRTGLTKETAKVSERQHMEKGLKEAEEQLND